MAISRQNLTPLDGFDNRIDWNSALERCNSRLVNSVRGGNLLAAHGAIFGATFLGFFVWNLVTEPTNLSGLRGFQYWGILVAVHALLAGGYAVVARVLDLDQPSFVTDALPVYRAQEVSPRQSAPAAVWARGVEGASRVNTSARRWVSPTRSTSAAETSWPEQPPLLQATERVDVGEVTWPDSAPVSTMLNAAPITNSNPSDELVSIDPGTHGDSGSQTWLDGFVESRSMDKEHRWSWVEAAAASWMSKRDKPDVTRNSADSQDAVIPDQIPAQPDDEPRATN